MRRFLPVCMAILACFVLLGCSPDSFTRDQTHGSEMPESNFTTRDRWAVNEYGLSYGSMELVVYKPGTTTYDMIDYFPDLVSVTATNGKPGYVWSAELLSCQPSGQHNIMEALSKKTDFRVYIPVYEADGTTEIGVFVTRSIIDPNWE